MTHTINGAVQLMPNYQAVFQFAADSPREAESVAETMGLSVEHEPEIVTVREVPTLRGVRLTLSDGQVVEVRATQAYVDAFNRIGMDATILKVEVVD